MKIIRWLLSHTFLILLIVTVIYGYMFWGNLLGEDTPAGKVLTYFTNEFDEVAEFVAAVKAKQEKSNQQNSSAIELSEAHESPAENEVSAVVPHVASSRDTQTQPAEIQAIEKSDFTAPVNENRRTDYPVSSSSSENRNIWQQQASQQQVSQQQANQQQANQQQASRSYSHNQVAVKPNATAEMKAVAKPIDYVVTTDLQSKSAHSDAQPASNGVTEDAFVTAEIESQLDNVDEQGRLKQDGLKQASQQDDIAQHGDTIRTNWIAARKSFYQRKYDLSEQNYQKVIDSTKDNVDAYGELGNVFFNQGKNEQAASAYFEAAAILVRKGQVDRARSLMGLLRHLDKSKANDLQKLIDSTVS